MQIIGDEDRTIIVMVSDMADPDYSQNSNKLFFDIKLKDLENFITICRDSNLCVNITFDFSISEEDK